MDSKKLLMGLADYELVMGKDNPKFVQDCMSQFLQFRFDRNKQNYIQLFLHLLSEPNEANKSNVNKLVENLHHSIELMNCSKLTIAPGQYPYDQCHFRAFVANFINDVEIFELAYGIALWNSNFNDLTQSTFLTERIAVFDILRHQLAHFAHQSSIRITSKDKKLLEVMPQLYQHYSSNKDILSGAMLSNTLLSYDEYQSRVLECVKN